MSESDLSKVDTYALGVILINMLTGNYLFKSCHDEEYMRIVSDFDYFMDILRLRISDISEAELFDLTVLL